MLGFKFKQKSYRLEEIGGRVDVDGLDDFEKIEVLMRDSRQGNRRHIQFFATDEIEQQVHRPA